jgi:hypothetical protein
VDKARIRASIAYRRKDSYPNRTLAASGIESKQSASWETPIYISGIMGNPEAEATLQRQRGLVLNAVSGELRSRAGGEAIREQD